ncbi:ABC transporter permease subunit [Aliidiomarina maris]|uniref:Cationic peptide transport system permease protein n=1 Tax=Aliidiomarina maris TaxID=531312 RepID=A0A327X3L2_9GAMM|nr:ABC transporter permease subunit [Aliidiomarina maris]MBA3987732.1 peptide ABC transporter permease [Idiomarina sp.]RAK01455.1 cationic peptide transport system permease protein [Aliidiomarina maris]RUO28292.1 peptide ABC transporter permease [Aliidiomarina maris]
MSNVKLFYEERTPSPLQQVWRQFRHNWWAMGALHVLGLVVILTLFAGWLSPHSPTEQYTDALSLPPAWDADGELRFILGTDELGRDMLSRILHGAQLSFGLPLLVVIAAALVGMPLGALAAMSRGVKSSTLKHLLDVLLSIPSLLLALIIIAILGPGLSNALLAIWLVLIPQFLHTTRNAIHAQRHQDYVIAAELNGVSQWYLLFVVIFPNTVKVLVVQVTMALSTAILDIAALGFLGLGAQSPAPEWGSMLAKSVEVAYSSPWVMALPGLALCITLISVNIVGDSLKSAIDERIKR